MILDSGGESIVFGEDATVVAFISPQFEYADAHRSRRGVFIVARNFERNLLLSNSRLARVDVDRVVASSPAVFFQGELSVDVASGVRALSPGLRRLEMKVPSRPFALPLSSGGTLASLNDRPAIRRDNHLVELEPPSFLEGPQGHWRTSIWWPDIRCAKSCELFATDWRGHRSVRFVEGQWRDLLSSPGSDVRVLDYFVTDDQRVLVLLVVGADLVVRYTDGELILSSPVVDATGDPGSGLQGGKRLHYQTLRGGTLIRQEDGTAVVYALACDEFEGRPCEVRAKRFWLSSK